MRCIVLRSSDELFHRSLLGLDPLGPEMCTDHLRSDDVGSVVCDHAPIISIPRKTPNQSPNSYEN